MMRQIWDSDRDSDTPDTQYTADVRDIAAGAFVVDETHHIVAWNEAAERLLGCSAGETIGRLCFEVLAYREGRRERFCASHCPGVRARGRRGGSSIEFVVQTAHGGVRRLTMATVAARAPSGAARIVHFLLDPHERRPIEREIVAVAGGDAPRDGESEAEVQLMERLAPERLPRVSPRELEVLGLLAQGHTPHDIAAVLGISRVTVRNHLTHVMEKLEVNTRLQAIVVASRLHLL
jgi:PAS domain S-box-containing protein